MPDLSLLVNGRKYNGWKSASIALGMEQIAGCFSLTVSEKWHGQNSAWQIMPGDTCRLLIGNTPVITGYVDDVNPSYDNGSHGVSVTGRDKTGDLVDCSAIHKSGEWVNVSLAKIATDLCAPFGITVAAATDTGKAFSRFSVQEGETVFECIERAARERGILLMSDGNGRLILTRSGTNRIGTALVKGKNIENASGQFSHKERYSKYIIKGQSPGSDWTSTTHNTQTKAIAEDNAVTRYRPLIIIGEQGDGSTYADRAKWERNVRAGRSSRISYTVTGWHHGAGLWLPNNLVTVNDDYLGVQGDMMLASVRMSLDDSGSKTELELCRKEAFSLINLPAKHKSKSDKDPDKW